MFHAVESVTEEQRLYRVCVQIMQQIPHIAAIMMIGSRVVTDDPEITTACTNGRDEWYSREFIKSLSDAELRFLVLHEVYHKLFRHLITWAHLSKISHYHANCACDYYINLHIMDEYGEVKTKHGKPFVKMPENGCYDEKYRGGGAGAASGERGRWNAARIFKDIYDKEIEGSPDGSPNGSGYGDDDGDGDNKSQGKGTNANTGKPLPKGFDDHDWDGAKDMSDEEKGELNREVEEAVRQGALVAAKTGSGGARELGELLKPKINWREALREFFMSTCAGSDHSTWRKPKRRLIGQDIYMPSTYSERVGVIADHNDMSGSIGDREQAIMLGAVSELCKQVKPEKLIVTYWDTKVKRCEEYAEHEIDDVTTKTKPTGGGGTDVRCVPEYLSKNNINPQASIILTDGHLYGGWGSWDHPTLWVILDNPKAMPPFGKAIHINSEDLV